MALGTGKTSTPQIKPVGPFYKAPGDKFELLNWSIKETGHNSHLRNKPSSRFHIRGSP